MADPGFPRGEGANPPGVGGGGAPTYDFAKISKKHCMELKEFEPPGRLASLAPLVLDSPLVATGKGLDRDMSVVVHSVADPRVGGRGDHAPPRLHKIKS